MKTQTKIFIFLAGIFFSFFFGKTSLAAYQDEGTAFYAQTNSSGYAAEGIAFYAYDPGAAQPSGTLPVYRFYNSTTGDHFYTASESEKDSLVNNSSSGYSLEGTVFFADASQADPAEVAVYRFYDSIKGKHFYTASTDERNALQNNPQWGYAYEGVAFYAYPSQITGTLPVYRFYNSTTGDHFYTASESEKDSISQAPVYRFYNPTTKHHFYTASESERSIVANTSQSGYLPEGIAYYAYNTQITGTLPVYRFNNSSTGDHFYTALEAEKNSLISNAQSGYAYEGIAFYAYATQSNGSSPVYRFYNPTTGDHFYTASESEKNYLLLSPLGPDISVGIGYYSKPDIQGSPFQIDASKTYNIKDNNGNIIATADGNTTTSVTYTDNGNLQVSNNSLTATIVNSNITFDAADGDNTTMVFNIHRSDNSSLANYYSSSLDHYRGTIKIQYYRGPDIYNDNTGSTVTQIWVINTLPLEEYVWGAGELTGTGPMEHTKVMTTIFRTYGYWYVKYAPKYAPLGFQIRSDSGSQIYNGYDWETQYPNIKTAAQDTQGTIVSYGGDVALTPYSSWSDGNTRSYQQVWGSTDYPWCQSVSDPYGNWYSYNSGTLPAGNHMVGLIAHGSLNLAGSPYDWTYDRILKYYYTGISLNPFY